MIRGNKGDAGMQVLIFSVLAIAAILIFVFISYKPYKVIGSGERSANANEISFSEIYVSSEALAVAKQCNIEEKVKECFIKETDERDMKITSFGNYYAKIRNGEFSFEKKEKKVELKIEGLSVRSGNENQQVTRNFDLIIEISDKEDKVRKIYK